MNQGQQQGEAADGNTNIADRGFALFHPLSPWRFRILSSL